jgi:type IV pilus assembly protein PilV
VQALVLLRDMADRINADRATAASYVTAAPLGTGSSTYSGTNCSTLATTQRSLCQWDQALKGAAESLSGANVGAMPGARGCVTSPAANQYLIQVAWQGMTATVAPPALVNCGSGSYGDEKQRRVVTTVVQIPTLS